MFGAWSFVVAFPPCRTFCLARGVGQGPPRVRGKKRPEGYSGIVTTAKGLAMKDLALLKEDNLLAERTAKAVKVMIELDRGFMEQP